MICQILIFLNQNKKGNKMAKTIEHPIAQNEMKTVTRLRKVYDNGGVSVDRYTATFDIYDEQTGKWFPFTDSIDFDNIKESCSKP